MTFWAGLLFGFRKALGHIWSIARAYPLHAACITLVLACVWLWSGKNAANDRAERYQAQIKSERALYTAAQQEAKARAIAAIEAKEAEYKDKANAADLSHAKALADANSRTERFIAANRVRNQAVGGASGGTIASAESDGPGGDNGPGETPFMVAVTPDDVRICTVNTERLIAAKVWADSLSKGN
jgi:hypothetical protein